MNVELLQKVKAHVLEEPRRVFMGAWCLQDVHMDCRFQIATQSLALADGPLNSTIKIGD
jgi:hypothetical protein